MQHKARPKGKVTDPSTRPKHSRWPQASVPCFLLSSAILQMLVWHSIYNNLTD